MLALHGTMEHSAETSRVIRSAHHHDGAEPFLVTPHGKHSAYVLTSVYIFWDLLDGVDTKRFEVSNGSRSRIFVGNATADELAVYSVGRIGENRDSRGHTAVNKVSGFEHPSEVGIGRQDNNVGGINPLIDNERPPGRPQNRSSHGGDTNDGSAQQHDHQHHHGPPRSTSDHVLHDIR